jgi:hypothetical protein
MVFSFSFGWLWLALVGFGWLWLALVGFGWLWLGKVSSYLMNQSSEERVYVRLQ